jgi:hypothetical protein
MSGSHDIRPYTAEQLRQLLRDDPSYESSSSTSTSSTNSASSSQSEEETVYTNFAPAENLDGGDDQSHGYQLAEEHTSREDREPRRVKKGRLDLLDVLEAALSIIWDNIRLSGGMSGQCNGTSAAPLRSAWSTTSGASDHWQSLGSSLASLVSDLREPRLFAVRSVVACLGEPSPFSHFDATQSAIDLFLHVYKEALSPLITSKSYRDRLTKSEAKVTSSVIKHVQSVRDVHSTSQRLDVSDLSRLHR